MKRSLLLLVGVMLVPLTAAAERTLPIRLNTLGYLPDAPKQATLSQPADRFLVRNAADDAEVFAGALTGPMTNPDTQETLYIADFSGLTDPGEYRLVVPGVGQSPAFRVASDLYRDPFRTVTRGMYLWRCGTAVRGEHQGDIFQHAACHTQDARLDFIGRIGETKDGTGGWHDAGDYNKYVVNAGVTVGAMFRAWEDFGPAIRQVALNLPEAGGPFPEFLAELKWEIDWLFSMQADDGRVYHKLSTQKFGGMILPEHETADRFFSPWSSAATASFTAMMAQASRLFQPYDPAYAARCLAAARRSYAFLTANPADVRADLSAFSTGTYGTRDADDRLWAAAELWETTGDDAVLRDLETRIRAVGTRVDADFDWGTVSNLGFFTYLASRREGRNESLVEELQESLLRVADGIVTTRNQHGYARPLGNRYYWGCNGSVARQSLILHAAHRVSPKRVYRETALDALNHLFGRNVYARSFVTGLGFQPPRHPHDRRSPADTVEAPWPGYLVGGPHPKATDWKDEQADYRTNEIAINWNGALIYALAAFLNGATIPDVPIEAPSRRPDVVFVPTPQAVVDRMLELAGIQPGDVVYDLGCGDGRIVVTAAKRYGVRAAGFDIDPTRVREARDNVRTNQVGHLVSIHQADIFTLDLREASVVMLYLLPQLNVRLMPQLAELRPGARILSHDFDMRGARPVLIERVPVADEMFGDWEYGAREHTIYKWIVPWEPENEPGQP